MSSATQMMTLGQAQQWVPDSRLVGDAGTPIARVHTDTRSIAAGDLFVALKGERFDANEFLADAMAAGAVAAIAHGGLDAAGLAGLEVADSMVALAALARGWRSQFDLPLIAITGSNGKTTVTQMVASILRAADADQALATAGNFNNEIGVPLTLFRLRANHRRAVVELGMNHPGEIARLAAMSRPTIALVNNAQREHQEFMSTVEAVAQENGAVYAALPVDGIAIFPYGDVFTPLWRDLATTDAPRRCLTFGEQPEADIRLVAARWDGVAWHIEVVTPAGAFACALHIAGHHNVINALAAVACAVAAGVSVDTVADGLSAFEPVKGRSRVVQFPRSGAQPLTVVDDTYNANPDSVRAAIEVLAALPGPTLLVLGDMGEVGDQAEAFHAEVGALARARGIDALFALGTESARAVAAFGAADGRHFDSIEALNAAVLAQLLHVGSLLVKGSRFMQMERVVQAVTAASLQQQEKEEAGHVA